MMGIPTYLDNYYTTCTYLGLCETDDVLGNIKCIMIITKFSCD